MESKTVRQIATLLLLAGVLAAGVNLLHPHRIPWTQNWSNMVEAKAHKEGIRVIPLSVALQIHNQKTAIFIDARSAKEFSEGHISSAQSIPLQQFDDHFEEIGNLIDAQKPLIVYCTNRDCDDALLLCIELQAMGAENLRLYIDGFEQWEHYGEIEKEEP